MIYFLTGIADTEVPDPSEFGNESAGEMDWGFVFQVRNVVDSHRPVLGPMGAVEDATGFLVWGCNEANRRDMEVGDEEG